MGTASEGTGPRRVGVSASGPAGAHGRFQPAGATVRIANAEQPKSGERVRTSARGTEIAGRTIRRCFDGCDSNARPAHRGKPESVDRGEALSMDQWPGTRDRKSTRLNSSH